MDILSGKADLNGGALLTKRKHFLSYPIENLWKVVLQKEELDVLGKTEGVSQDINQGVHLFWRKLESEECCHDAGEGRHVVRGVQGLI